MALCSVVLFFIVLPVVAVRRSVTGRGWVAPATPYPEPAHTA